MEVEGSEPRMWEGEAGALNRLGSLILNMW